MTKQLTAGIISIGDWVQVNYQRLGIQWSGYVVKVDAEYIEASVWRNNGFHTAYVPIERAGVEVVPCALELEDIDKMIDLALDTKDYGWCAELTELRKLKVKSTSQERSA